MSNFFFPLLFVTDCTIGTIQYDTFFARFLMVWFEVKILVSVCWFTIHWNWHGTILAFDQTVQESHTSILFKLDSESLVLACIFLQLLMMQGLPWQLCLFECRSSYYSAKRRKSCTGIFVFLPNAVSFSIRSLMIFQVPFMGTFV